MTASALNTLAILPKLASMGIPYLFYEITEGVRSAGANISEASFTTEAFYDGVLGFAIV